MLPDKSAEAMAWSTAEVEPEVKRSGHFALIRDGYRYVIVALALLCLTTISAGVQSFNFAVVCMSPSENRTAHFDSHPIIPYTLLEQTYLNWAVGFGSALGTFPYSVAYTRYGAKHILGVAGLCSAALAAITPFAAEWGLWPFFVVRFLQGVAYAADFAAIGLLCTKWAPLSQNAFYVSALTSYSSLSSLLTFLASGFMCEGSIGWPLIYYSVAACGVVFFALWLVFYVDDPADSPFVSNAEIALIQSGKGDEEIHHIKNTPYKEILTNPVCWTIWYNSFAEIATSFFLYSFVAKFHNHVLHFDLHTAGLMSALPSAIYIPLRIVMGYVNDRISFLPTRVKLITFNSVALILPGFFYIAVGFIGEDLRALSVFCFVMIYIFYAFSGGGFYKCATLTARQYSHFVIANIQFIKCITLFAGPALFEVAIKDEGDITQWRTAFIVIAALLFSAGILFNVMCTDKPQRFTKQEAAAPSSAASSATTTPQHGKQ